jgi:RHS repeat-associated protein
LGTPRDIAMRDPVTGDVEIVNSRQYNSFGVSTGESNSSFSILWAFTGRLYDPETGMQLHWKRWYITNLGIWASEDPIGFEGGDFNLGRYLGANPVDQTDPTGNRGTSPILIGGWFDWLKPAPPPKLPVFVRPIPGRTYGTDFVNMAMKVAKKFPNLASKDNNTYCAAHKLACQWLFTQMTNAVATGNNKLAEAIGELRITMGCAGA